MAVKVVAGGLGGVLRVGVRTVLDGVARCGRLLVARSRCVFGGLSMDEFGGYCSRV